MERVQEFFITQEDVVDQLGVGRFNPCLELTMLDGKKERTYKLAAGYEDEIHVFREEGHVFVVTINNRLGYAGIDVFRGADKVEDMFLDPCLYYHEFKEESPSPDEVLQRIRQYVCV